MDSLIGLVNRLQRACTALGDYGGESANALPTLWESLPSVVVVGKAPILLSGPKNHSQDYLGSELHSPLP